MWSAKKILSEPRVLRNMTLREELKNVALEPPAAQLDKLLIKADGTKSVIADLRKR